MQLEAAGLSALAIGDDMHAPPLSPALLERADQLAFPLLAIPRDVPFVAVSRAVANANSDEEHKRLVDTVQLYEVLRGAVSTGRVGSALLDELGRQLRCRLVLVDAATALPVVAVDPPPPPGLGEHLIDELHARGGVFPSVMRVRHDGVLAIAMHVPTRRPTALVAMHTDDQATGPGASPARGEHRRARRGAGHRRTRARTRGWAPSCWRPCSSAGSSRPRRNSSSTSTASRRRARAWSSFGPSPSGADEGNLHHELAQRGVPHLVLWDAERCLARRARRRPRARARCGPRWAPRCALGVSDPLRQARPRSRTRPARPAGRRPPRRTSLGRSCATARARRCSSRARW